ncbi:hypothetical protein CIT37_32125 [Bradyrhizobium ottawaense]|uniref:Uncharacterized protein n=1 Tax=Bradyrhizobium ottawaense TaxID=931866 RepID=A0A2U8PEU6_9BRAD|nr:hypothetical protein [Bradyrhizobium ottawaense]AWL96256.1 hypothetical protein CIT37_32125 [Bradyrhizobium ottawaense]
MNRPKVIIVGSGAAVSMFAVDLADEAEALALARLITQQTGRVVTVHDAEGEFVGTIRPLPKN